MSDKPLICDIGPYKGISYKQLPISFLHWMINNKHEKCDLAVLELTKRTEAVKRQKN